MEPWKFLYSGESSLDCRNVLQIKNNGSERFFLEPKMFHLLLPFGIFSLENVKQLWLRLSVDSSQNNLQIALLLWDRGLPSKEISLILLYLAVVKELLI